MNSLDRNLPGLTDLECAARWGSFRLAAVELHKTPAAVSQQIKQLERSLGFPLFVRHPRHVALTDKGRELANTLTRLLKDLRLKVAALQEGDEESVLRLSATHSFAMKWLVPRLHRFTERHPQIDIRVDANDQLVELEGGGNDIAIRHARVDQADSDADVLYREHLVVAFSPRMRSIKPNAPSSLATLSRHPLLYEGTPEGWLRLMEANGLKRRAFDFSHRYSHAGLLVQAAVAGHGVALVPYSLACEDIRAGRLSLCACMPLASPWGYRLLCSGDQRTQPKVDAFTTWIRGEVQAMIREFTAGGAAE